MAYSYYRAITVDESLCGSADSTDFPLLFAGTYSYLATVANGGKVQNANGYDIGFFADSALTTPLDWEVVEYNATTGKIEAHVRVPTLSASTDTVIYVAYGDSGISTFQGDVAGTWDSNFKLVSHLPDGATLTADDSTTNGNDGTVTGAVAAAGKVGGCASFDGSGDKIDFGSSSSVDDMTALTLETWVRRDTIAGTADRYLLSKVWDDGSGFGGWWFYIRRASDGTNGSKVFFARAWSGSTFDSAIWRGATKINTTSAWYRLVVTYDGASTANDPTIYINGVAETLTESQAPSGTLLSDAAYQVLAGDSLYGSNVLDGFLDELRVSNVVRSANYVLASYNNQNDPSTFYALGSEVGGAASATASGSFTVAGSATATVPVSAAASGGFTIAGSATATVPVSAAATGSFTVAGSATAAVGNPPVSADAAGSLTVAGSATATVAIAASASGGMTVGGSATATVAISATASGSFTVAGSATAAIGNPPVTATASGSFTISGSATATVAIAASASGSFTVSGAAAATVPVTAAVSGGFTVAGSAEAISGFAPAIGAASGGFTVSGSATASVAVSASATGVILLDGSALANVSLLAVASGSFTISGSATALATFGVPPSTAFYVTTRSGLRYAVTARSEPRYAVEDQSEPRYRVTRRE